MTQHHSFFRNLPPLFIYLAIGLLYKYKKGNIKQLLTQTQMLKWYK